MNVRTLRFSSLSLIVYSCPSVCYPDSKIPCQNACCRMTNDVKCAMDKVIKCQPRVYGLEDVIKYPAQSDRASSYPGNRPPSIGKRCI